MEAPAWALALDPFTPILRALPAVTGVASGVAHMRGMRGAMEDAFAACPVPGAPFLFLCVLDGHGGRGVADYAAQQLLPCVLATREWAAAAAGGFEDSAALRAALRGGFAACDAAAHAALPGDRSGACALAALVSPQRTIVANCGDCRAVLVPSSSASSSASPSRCAVLTADHRPDAHAERARLAPLAGAAAVGKSGYSLGLAVSRSLGDFRTKLDHARSAAGATPPLLPTAQQTLTSDPEVFIVEGGGGAEQLLLLACDGVWDVLSNEEACEFIARDVVAAAGAAGAARAAAIAAQGSSSSGGSGGGDGGAATSAAAAAEEAASAAAALYLGGTAERLRTLVLARTAKAEGVTVRQLQSLKPGKGGRRNVHDDITAVILFVGGLPGVARFASGVAGGADAGAGAGAGAGQELA